MQVQAAIDRVSVEKASEIISEVADYADVIEIGTSLIKDYGLTGSVTLLKKKYPEQIFLADMKTCDEGEYEFRKAYEAGADIATVMGFSAVSTIRACADMANTFGRDYMIDLLETGTERIALLTHEFPDAIFAVHLPSDQEGRGLEELVRKEVKQLGSGVKIAAAGGIRLNQMPFLKDCGVSLVIVGSGITKADDRRAAAEAFYKAAAEA